MKKNKLKKGFTLIELVVVVTIIAVLTVVAVVSFGGVNKKSRDSRRMADMEKIRIALEMAKQVGSTYPAEDKAMTAPALVSGGYLTVWPTGPKNGGYYYNRATAYSYFIDTTMEDSGSTNVAPFAGCDSVCNYRVTNP
jgi:prepilin-type N-terminal cleavage/methylation domain-containing protein